MLPCRVRFGGILENSHVTNHPPLRGRTGALDRAELQPNAKSLGRSG